MPNVVRMGDTNDGGGVVCANTCSTIFCDGKPVAKIGSIIAPHQCCGHSGCEAHCHAVITTGESSILVEGVPIAVVGSMNSCGHHMAVGSGSVSA